MQTQKMQKPYTSKTEMQKTMSLTNLTPQAHLKKPFKSKEEQIKNQTLQEKNMNMALKFLRNETNFLLVIEE